MGMDTSDRLWLPARVMARWLRSPDVSIIRKLVLGPFVLLALVLYVLIVSGVLLVCLVFTLLLIVEFLRPWL